MWDLCLALTFIADGRNLPPMILGYINTKGRYASPSEQEQSVRSYADCYNLTIDKFLKTDDLAKTLPSSLKQGDVLIVADISIIGERFEDIILSLIHISEPTRH